MTGRIEELATPQKAGRIATNSGLNRSHYSYQCPITATAGGLSLGQLVSFELERGSPECAVGVRPKELGEPSAGQRTLPREIRYEGFEQTRNIRAYKFQAWRSGEENEEAVVTADLDLFRKHGIGIQDGPEMCLRLIEAEFQESGDLKPLVWTRALSLKEILAHLERRVGSKGFGRKRT